jgi:hypothetical protein
MAPAVATASASPSSVAQMHPQGDPYPMRRVRLGDCDIDTHTQRPIERPNVDRIKQTFDWRLFNPITVYEDTDDHRFKVIGGQHHTIAAKEKYGDDVEVWAKVVPFKSKEEMALLGLLDNISQAPVTSVSEWRSRVKSGEPSYVLVNAVINQQGATVGPSAHQVSAVRMLERIMRDRTPEEAMAEVQRVLVTIVTAWPNPRDDYRFKTVLIKNIYDLLQKFPQIDAVDFGERLSEREAREYYMLSKQPGKTNFVALEMVNAYNARRKAYNRLVYNA